MPDTPIVLGGVHTGTLGIAPNTHLCIPLSEWDRCLRITVGSLTYNQNVVGENVVPSRVGHVPIRPHPCPSPLFHVLMPALFPTPETNFSPSGMNICKKQKDTDVIEHIHIERSVSLEY